MRTGVAGARRAAGLGREGTRPWAAVAWRPGGGEGWRRERRGELASAFAGAWARERVAVAEAVRTELEVAASAFQHIGGIVPERLSEEDRERLQLLDAVIARLHAAERRAFVALGREDPETRRLHYEEFLRRLNGARPRAGGEATRRGDVVGRVAQGDAVTLRLCIRRLTPSGLVALGQLVHYEREVVVEVLEPEAAERPPDVGAVAAGGADGCAAC